MERLMSRGCLFSAELSKQYTAGFEVTSLYVASNSGMVNELERIWREAVVA
jgi:hypothetical protein